MFKREIKSFVHRQRKLTTRQATALAEAWPQFGITEIDAALDLDKIFHRSAKKILEIGFGHGNTLISMAQKNPDQDYLGIEVHEPGVASVMMQIIEHKITNIRVIQNDVVKILQDNIHNYQFSRIHLYFPDPWPKLKHHKRRLVQPEFIELLCQKLTKNGVLHFATDWEHYAMQMMRVLSENIQLKNSCGENQFANNTHLQLRSNTKFEKRGVKLGHGVWDLLFAKI